MSTCTITGTILTLAGTPAASQQIVFSIKSTADDQGGQLASFVPAGETVPVSVGITSDAVTVFTDADGEFEVELVRGARVMVEVPAINLRKEILVPDADTAEFATLV